MKSRQMVFVVSCCLALSATTLCVASATPEVRGADQMARADMPGARAVSRGPGMSEAWVVPSADGSICTFIADAIDGYASSCATANELRAGGSITALASFEPDGIGVEAEVVVVVPDLSSNPRVVRSNGSIQEIPIAENAGSALVRGGETIVAGGVRMTIPARGPADCKPPNRAGGPPVCDF